MSASNTGMQSYALPVDLVDNPPAPETAHHSSTYPWLKAAANGRLESNRAFSQSKVARSIHKCFTQRSGQSLQLILLRHQSRWQTVCLAVPQWSDWP